MRTRHSLWLTAFAALVAGCSKERGPDVPAPTFDADVAAILAARCSACHGAESPAGGFKTTSYLETIGCVGDDATPATSPADGTAPILAVLSRPDHAAILTEDERSVLAAWVDAGAPAFRGWVHDASFVDPRSPNFHGRYLRGQKWRPMLDGNDPNACGRCHDGAPARPATVDFGAPQAPACTSCHTEPGGPLACGTCHGDGKSRAMPPRDRCFFPEDDPGAHAAHVNGKPEIVGAGLDCSTCHPVPGADPSKPIIGNGHGDGTIDLRFDPNRASNHATFDRETATCVVACHDHGGNRAHPAWFDQKGPMGCNDCHTAPPADHYAGKCSFCHHTADDDGTKLVDVSRHLNGKVDLGNASGGCGACHGDGANDPWPTDGAHPTHRTPPNAAPVACESCHVVPKDPKDPGHLNHAKPEAALTFSGAATARGVSPSWNGTSCKDVACHGGGLEGTTAAEPVWKDESGRWKACGSCHGLPPGAPHTTLTSCESIACHGAEVTPTPNGPVINASRRALHVDGKIDLHTQ